MGKYEKKQQNIILPRAFSRMILDPRTSDSELAAFLRAAYTYYITREEPQELPDKADIMFSMFIDFADSCTETWEKNSRRQSERRKKADTRSTTDDPRTPTENHGKPTDAKRERLDFLKEQAARLNVC